MQYFDSHPTLDLVELYVLQRLDDEELPEMEEHLLLCNQCRLMAEALECEIKLIQLAFEIEPDSLSKYQPSEV